jgi:hypothetical protein
VSGVDEGPSRHVGPAVVGFILFVVAAAFAMSVDVPRTGYGIKSDEATYVAAALSAAYDGDLAYTKHDLDRFAGLYHAGPGGIFLKRGKIMRISVRGPFPFVHKVTRADPDSSRLYFGKSVAYSLFAAPFVRFFGLNGLLLSHVVLLCAAAVAAYMFLAAQSPPLAAVAFVTAFVGASQMPVYSVFLMPETFNFTLVLLAYFFWLYKEVAPGSRLNQRWTDVVAVVLLGIATYSKPIPVAPLVAPIVALAWIRKRWTTGFTLGAIAVFVACLLFAFNAAVSGEFNYQGGDRKYFSTRFPFESPASTWESFNSQVTTDTSTPKEVLSSGEAPARFAHNVEYFIAGRHFGFVPYFFPGVVAIGSWLLSRSKRDRWRQLVFIAIVGSAIETLILWPWTWSGGGGPPGNRYFSAVYPLVLFLVPPGASLAPGVLAWMGGAVFTAQMLVNPFWAAKFPYLVVEKGPLRRLPVELTMANDLPVRLAQPLRGHVQYRNDPGVLLYFLDQNAWPPEPNGIWVSGSGRAEVIVRSATPIERLEVEAESPIHTVLTVALGGAPVTITMQPHQIYPFTVEASGVRGFGDYNYLLIARSTEGFVPHLLEPANMDYRNLGAQLRFRPIITSAETALPK